MYLGSRAEAWPASNTPNRRVRRCPAGGGARRATSGSRRRTAARPRPAPLPGALAGEPPPVDLTTDRIGARVLCLVVHRVVPGEIEQRPVLQVGRAGEALPDEPAEVKTEVALRLFPWVASTGRTIKRASAVEVLGCRARRVGAGSASMTASCRPREVATASNIRQMLLAVATPPRVTCPPDRDTRRVQSPSTADLSASSTVPRRSRDTNTLGHQLIDSADHMTTHESSRRAAKSPVICGDRLRADSRVVTEG